MEKDINLIKKIISIPSVTTNQKAVLRCQKLIRNYLGKTFICQEVKSGNFTSYILSKEKTKKFDVLFYGHLDVVPADKKAFTPKIKNNRLYGRGSLDMKSSTVIQAVVMKENKFENLKVGLVLVPDEEVGGMNGLYRVLKSGFRANVVIIPDGGKGKSIITMQKGICFYRLTFSTAGGHGSRPWLSENAALKSVDFFNRMISDLKINNRSRNRGTTINLGAIKSGEKNNVIPNESELLIDARFSSLQDKKRFESYLIKYKKEIKIEKVIEGDIFNCDNGDKLLNVFQKIVKVPFNYESGGSDARFLTEYDIPAIIYQPKGDNHHAENEWVSLSSLEKFKKDLVEYLRHLDKNYNKYFK
jgi:succinyl-diaminopimelate desuccinylase